MINQAYYNHFKYYTSLYNKVRVKYSAGWISSVRFVLREFNNEKNNYIIQITWT